MAGNRQSPPETIIGLRPSGPDRVRVWCEGGVVADHERVWARHQTISDAAHVRAAQLLRQQRFTLLPPDTETEVEQRSLIDYDTALGVAEFDEEVAL